MVNRNVIIAEVGQRVMQAQKILIIDDSATSCALIERALHGEGYQILIAADGREGLAMAIQEQPHCIILDVVLPGMNGFEVCRTLRTRPKYRDLPIIMVSTKNTPLDKSWALRQGATHYLAKPFKPNDILELVKGALLRYAPPAQFEEPASTSKAQDQPPMANPQVTAPMHIPPFAPPPARSRMGEVDPGRLSNNTASYGHTTSRPQQPAEHRGRVPIHKLIPQYPEGTELFPESNAYFLRSIDQPTRTLYEAVDGQKDIETLCEVTHMSQEEIIRILRSLLIQHRVQICDPTGKVLHSAVLFSGRM
ncbi:MAG: response regulator [Ktedonobacteraceae bacterium]|nr:response regulator [Ktedonobacteraceae bacterium]